MTTPKPEPKLFTVRDIADRIGRPVWWVRRRLKALKVKKAGRFYEVTLARLRELHEEMAAAVDRRGAAELLADEDDECMGCVDLRIEKSKLEGQLADLTRRLVATAANARRR